ncbi:UNVERIFIED_CONTAM: Retrovirus-related Pol polyprotein from transposon RE2 [Sesamum latifolium]|uniref:Retrovirus-related Pol polyprotein from transposon RE2 n=1 Tax=Sesamum latifolium TaxID=2727402 RepID=A0AAW2VYZ4_9LAMI
MTEKNHCDSDLESSGMVFVSSPLNGDNYLVWNKAMWFALGSRMKLSFIDGRSARPPEGSPDLDEWTRKDYMAITWILNNVPKMIVDAFMYVTSARSLWLELEAIYDKSCTCAAHKSMVTRKASHQLMQFLMGLSSRDANVRSQILVIDPMPDVTKAFAMLLNVEKELQTMELNSKAPNVKPFSMIMAFYTNALVPALHNKKVAEHKHRHLLAVAQALLFQASLPERFEGDCDPTLPSCCLIPLVPQSVDDSYAPTSSPNTVPLSLTSTFAPLSSLPDVFPASSRNNSYVLATSEPGPEPPRRSAREPRSYKEAAPSKEWKELKDDWTVDRYKARLATKGYTHVKGVDYVESFSPVAKAVIVRLLLDVSVARNWEIHQLDVNNAFHHGRLDEEIFMTPSEGYRVAEGSSCHDHCLFTKGSNNEFIALVYVDDVSHGSLLPDPEPYRRLVGRFLYLGFTRPDIYYGVQQLSQFLLHPCDGHWASTLHLVRFLKSTPHTGLFFPSSSSSLELRAYCNIDSGSCLDTRRSIFGFCILLGSALVSLKSKK